MKTVSKKEEIERVSESEVDSRIKSGWKFTPKSEWKKKVRDINKKEKTETEKIDKKIK